MYEKTADEIMRADPDLAIIPVGSIEQHGPHLPIMTDWRIAQELGGRVAERLGAMCLPALPVSTNREQMGKKGTVYMEPVTFYQMMTDMILCLKQQGFRRVGIVQCHGGVFIMTPLVRDLNARHAPDLQVAVADTCSLYEALRKDGVLETDGNLHAGEVETSIMLALAPETVHMERAVDCVPTIPRSYLNYGSLLHACPDGVWGHATRGTAEKGRRMLDLMTDLMAEQLTAAFRYMDSKEPIFLSHF